MRRQGAARQAAWGIFAALIAALLILAGIAPTGRIGFYVMAALCAAAVWHISGMRDAVLCVLAAILTALILLPDKLAALPFMLFGAPHALVWCAVGVRPRRVRLVCKGALALAFGGMAWLGAGLAMRLFAWLPQWQGWVFGLAVAAVLPVYDVVFTGAMRVVVRYLDRLGD